MTDQQSEYSNGGNGSLSGGALNPQLARLTATLRKKRCELGHPGPCRPAICGGRTRGQVNIHENTLQLAETAVSPAEVVFRAVSPHGHVYWEINPTTNSTKGEHQHQPKGVGGGQPTTSANNKSQHSTTSSEENTNSDLQNLSDFSDDDHGGVLTTARAHSEMSRQSSSRFSESRPLIYSSSSASTSPGNSAASAAEFAAVRHHQGVHMIETLAGGHHNKLQPRFSRGMGRPWNGAATMSPNYHEEVYAYAATDFSGGNGTGPIIPEQVQSQVQIRDCRAVPVSVKSKEYIMAKIADYTERHMNHQV